MSIEAGERDRAERALEELASAELSDLQTLPWPSVAGRIRKARLAAGMNDTEVAWRLSMTVNAYCDLELHNDEAFTVVSLKQLVELGRILHVHPRVFLLGREEEGGKQTVTFDNVTARLAERVNSGLTVEELGELIGWDIKIVLNSPNSL